MILTNRRQFRREPLEIGLCQPLAVQKGDEDYWALVLYMQNHSAGLPQVRVKYI